MIKKITLYILNIYQNFVSSSLHQIFGINQGCRFEITCSEYAKTQILNKGVVRGSLLALERILKCQPFYNQAV